MELDYRLTTKQEQALRPIERLASANDYSWVLTRHQGTGLKYWRISFTEAPEFAGELYEADGRTITELVARTYARMAALRPPDDRAADDDDGRKRGER